MEPIPLAKPVQQFAQPQQTPMPRGVKCNICGMGWLRKRTTYRLGLLVAVIGWLLLAPSILGITTAVVLAVLMWVVAVIGEGDMAPLLAITGFLAWVGVSCFVGGLLGWLLILTKTILQCDNCGAVTPAS